MGRAQIVQDRGQHRGGRVLGQRGIGLRRGRRGRIRLGRRIGSGSGSGAGGAGAGISAIGGAGGGGAGAGSGAGVSIRGTGRSTGVVVGSAGGRLAPEQAGEETWLLRRRWRRLGARLRRPARPEDGRLGDRRGQRWWWRRRGGFRLGLDGDRFRRDDRFRLDRDRLGLDRDRLDRNRLRLGLTRELGRQRHLLDPSRKARASPCRLRDRPPRRRWSRASAGLSGSRRTRRGAWPGRWRR